MIVSTIDFATMTDADDVNDQLLVSQITHQPVIANSIAPGMGITTHRLAGTARVTFGEVLEKFDYPALHRSIKF